MLLGPRQEASIPKDQLYTSALQMKTYWKVKYQRRRGERGEERGEEKKSMLVV